METLILKTRPVRSIGTQFVSGLLIALALGLLPVSSAFADRDDWGDRDGGWRHGDRDRGGWRGDDDHDEWRRRGGYGNGYGYGGYQPAYPQPYGYAQPVYVPPPVYYVPQQSPGINLVFPLNFR